MINPDIIGLAPLRREQPSLTGSGVYIGHVEGSYGSFGYWEVNPADSGVNQPSSLFTWISALGSTTSFPNAAGNESTHANGVAAVLYGSSSGVAPGVQHVRNYEAGYYVNNVVGSQLPVSAPDMVVNDSWFDDSVSDSAFDNFAVNRNVLFVSGMNNTTDSPHPPGTCYNGLGVGGLLNSSIGPTTDNGRSKPDIIVAVETFTSLLTPAVSGAAALLLQAAARNDGGPGTASLGTNIIAIKALLLNGAVKPTGWTNGVTRPLDARWGAGAMNVYNSWHQLRAGRAPYIAASTASLGSPHPPTADSANVGSLRGWDVDTVTSSRNTDGITHYYFVLPPGGGSIANATLVWNRASGASTAKDLDLFLYQLAATNLVASSESTVDNVEHLFAPNLPPGRYDLQVLKHGGQNSSGTETYALAWDFVLPALALSHSGANIVLSWPINEAGLVLQSAASISVSIQWQDVNGAPFITNSQNMVTVPVPGTTAYFRLLRH